MPSRPVLIGRGLVPTTYKTPHVCTRPLGSSQTTNPPVCGQEHTQQHNDQDIPSPAPLDPRVCHKSYGGHSERETPGPIPNPEVKPFSADGTATERLWESRTPPNIFSVRSGTTTSGPAPDAFHDVPCARRRNGRQGTTDARTALYRT